jgi:predicted nucleotide-binding protein
MNDRETLVEISRRLKIAAAPWDLPDSQEPVLKLEDSARSIGRSFSGSWMGYHSRVYYDSFGKPPPGNHFSQEWGLMDMSGTSLGTFGEWREYDADAVKLAIQQRANFPNLSEIKFLAKKAEDEFLRCRSELESVLESELSVREDHFISKLKNDLSNARVYTLAQISQLRAPTGRIMTRDTVVIGQGIVTPPHEEVISGVFAVRQAFTVCASTAQIADLALSHLERNTRRKKASDRIGTNVFIGHGRSGTWRDLKDFIQDRLGLPWDEFNRLPVAGVTNIARLSEMLDAAAVAFLVMTAEDETNDGQLRARMNVIHEAGLFQGRLGFSKAIVLLEEGCEEFSNIQGLGQIRFLKGNISTAFEEIRRVLEREGLIIE